MIEFSKDPDVWIHAQLTSQIDKEFGLLGQRMTWLIGTNAFLFTGFLISMSAASKHDAVLGGLARFCSLSIVGSIGLYVCYVSFVSMAAARQVISEMKIRRQVYEEKIMNLMDCDFHITVPRDKGRDSLGNMIYRDLPAVFTTAWVLLLAISVSVLSSVGYSLMFLVVCWLVWFLIFSIIVDDKVKKIKGEHANQQSPPTQSEAR